MRACRNCLLEKPDDEFTRYANGKPKRQCRKCHSAETRAWFRANRERGRELHRALYWKHRDAVTAKQREARRGKPDGQRAPGSKAAKDAVYRAVKAGRLIRPESCPRCQRSDVPIQAHHHSYDRVHWLSVEWLCKWCHESSHHGTISGPHAAPAFTPGFGAGAFAH